jgi:hypothetical protein
VKTFDWRKRDARTRLRGIAARLMLLATQVETEAREQRDLDRLARTGDEQVSLLEAAVADMTDAP